MLAAMGAHATWKFEQSEEVQLRDFSIPFLVRIPFISITLFLSVLLLEQKLRVCVRVFLCGCVRERV
jgi:hypothetical protein